MTVGTNQIEAGEHNRDQGGAKKQVDLPSDTIINLPDPQRRLFFALVVLDKQAGNRCVQCRLPGLQRKTYLSPRFFFFAVASERKGAIGCIPKLRHRVGQILSLLGSAGGDCDFFLEAQRVV